MSEATLLGDTIRRLSKPLAPQPTGVEPRLPKLEGIRAVVFDVYGTLLISGSGDISLTSGVSQGEAAAKALDAVGVRSAAAGDAIVSTLHQVIKEHHAESSHQYPEVEIREIWRETAARFCDGETTWRDEAFPQLATEYECRVNPIWPMPGCGETLAALRNAKIPLGIVSNAQFFTPIAMEELLGESMASLGFEASRCVWSYKHLQAKPGKFLYQRMAEALAADGIPPGEALYIGNDMRNDVAPAAAVGFRTALFAGDARSLRLREGDPQVAGVEPDAVITELPQILRILPLADR